MTLKGVVENVVASFIVNVLFGEPSAVGLPPGACTGIYEPAPVVHSQRQSTKADIKGQLQVQGITFSWGGSIELSSNMEAENEIDNYR